MMNNLFVEFFRGLRSRGGSDFRFRFVRGFRVFRVVVFTLVFKVDYFIRFGGTGCFYFYFVSEEMRFREI